MFRKLLIGASAAVAALGLAASANAATVLVSDVGVYNWNQVSTGLGDFTATGITFNNSLLVFCADLQHTIGVTHYDPPLQYTVGFLTVDGAGNAITEADSNRIGQLANAGHKILLSGDPDFSDDLTAIQGAIWSIEYHTTVTSANAEINDEIAQFLTVADNGKGYARALIAHGPGLDGVQNMVLGAPEPATWAMMLLGVFGLGSVLRMRRRQERAQVSVAA
jgi:hypothetical protein